MMTKLTNRQKQAIDTKLKIIKTTIELYKDFEYDNVKIKDICEHANISVGAFYHHFQSKDDVINGGYESIDLLLNERIEEREFINTYESITSILCEAGDILQEFGCKFVSQVYRQILITKEKYLLKKERITYVTLKKIIEEGFIRNEIKSNLSAEEITNSILRLTRGVIYDWCLHDGSYDLREYILKDLDILLASFIVINRL
jgi:AcrR family transcriptional regulator